MVLEDEICLKDNVWNVEKIARDPKQRMAVKHVLVDNEIRYEIHQS